MRRLIANSILSLISPLLLLTLQIHSLNAREVTVINNCTFTVWPVISSSSSSVANLSLKNQDSFTVDLQPSGSAFLWGRTLCDNSTGKLSCRTGDCGDNNCASGTLSWLFGVTFLEFHLDDVEGDTYDVRVERGYNVAVSVAPRGGNGSMCGVAGCVFNGTAGGQDSHLMTISRACPRAQANNSANELSCRGAHSYTVTFCPTSTSIISEISRPFEPARLQSPPASPAPRSLPQPGKTNVTGIITHAQPPDTAKPANHTKRKRKWSPTIVSIVVLTAVVSTLLLLGIRNCMRKRIAKKRHSLDKGENKSVESLQFNISTIRTATNHFSADNKLGEGGFGEVYKGKLESGQEVAVKRLVANSKQGVAEFKTEVALVAKLQHKNLVKLMGFCETSKEKILIYEFVRHSSLDRFLFDPTQNACLDWQARLNIIVGIARGLLYLHEDSRLKVIHRDLKTSNILLDEAMNPKISDFGLAKLFGEDQTQDDTKRIVGTRGYMAPEYVVTGHYSVRSDVYSFGVIVLEIISGQQSRFGGLRLEEAMLYRAWRLWSESKPLDFVDTRLNNNFPEEEVTRCFHIGLLCIQEDPVQRPRMRSILDAISRPAVSLPEPTPPRFFGNRSDVEDCQPLPYVYTGIEMITDIYSRD